LSHRETIQNLDHHPDNAEIRKAVWNLKEWAPGDSGIIPQVWTAIIENESTFDLLNTVIYDFWD